MNSKIKKQRKIESLKMGKIFIVYIYNWKTITIQDKERLQNGKKNTRDLVEKNDQKIWTGT